MTTGQKPPEPVRVAAPVPAPVTMDAVLVASRDLTAGSVVADADMRWQPWPIGQVPQGAIARSAQPNVMADLRGLYVKLPVSAGEILHADRLSKDPGFMAAALQSGMRAIAIDLTDQGRSYAGGFIRPSDHVDVIRTFHPDDTPSIFISETILTNVRVLAIGPAEHDKAGERTVFGSTATLEVTPQQAEKVILAQRVGQLSLSLRSVSDASKDEKPETMTIIRSGNASQARVLQ